MFKSEKRGQSQVLVIVLFIAIVIVAISIIWNVILNANQRAEESLKVEQCRSIYGFNEESFVNCVISEVGVERAQELGYTDENQAAGGENNDLPAEQSPDFAETYTLEIEASPLDQGVITVKLSGGINLKECWTNDPQPCTYSISAGTSVTLEKEGNDIKYWSGCDYFINPNTCVLSMDSNKLVKAIFETETSDSNSAKNFPVHSLISHWSFDDSSYSGRWNEVTDNFGLNHGVARNGANTASGFGKNAVNFDGSNDYIEVKYSSTLGIANSDFTICTMVKSTGSNLPIISNGISNKDFSLSISRGNAAIGLHGATAIGKTPINDNNWHFVCATSDKTGLGIFIDGKNDNPDTLGNLEMRSSFLTNNIFIGISEDPYIRGNSYFKGSLDEMMIFDRALEDEQVSLLFGFFKGINNGLTTQPDPLSVVQASKLTENSILISWDENAGEDYKVYRIYRSLNRNGPFEAIAVVPPYIKSYIDYIFVKNELKYYYVTSSSIFESAPSEIVSSNIIGSDIPQYEPLIVEAYPLSSREVKITWKYGSSSNTCDNIFCEKDSGKFKEVAYT